MRDAPELYGPKHRRIGEIHLTYARVAVDRAEARRHLDEALEAFDAAIGPDHITTMITRRNLAVLAMEAGDLDAADAYLADVQKVIDEDEPAHVGIRSDLKMLQASILFTRGDYEAALEPATEAYAARADHDDPTNRLEVALVYARVKWAANVDREELPDLVRAAMKGVADVPLNAGVLADARAFLEEHG